MFCSNRIAQLSRLLIQVSKKRYQDLFPLICILCQSDDCKTLPICRLCLHELPILPQSCRQCGLFLGSKAQSDSICGACLKKRPVFDQTYACFPYEPPLIQWIGALKFHGKLIYADVLGKLMLKKITACWHTHRPLPDLILPVPLHRHRLAERGFNQALEIAKPIARALALPIDRLGLIRKKQTAAQSGLTATARQQNMHQAFMARRRYDGLKIALIDDVITTGHTITACSMVLRKMGAHTIDVWCVARRG